MEERLSLRTRLFNLIADRMYCDAGERGFDVPPETVGAIVENLERLIQYSGKEVGAVVLGSAGSGNPVSASCLLEDADQLTPVEGVDYAAVVDSLFLCDDLQTAVIDELKERTVVYGIEQETALLSYFAQEDESDLRAVIPICDIDRNVEGYLSVVDRNRMPFRGTVLLDVLGFVKTDSDSEMVAAYGLCKEICEEKGWNYLSGIAEKECDRHMEMLYDCRGF